MPATAFSCVNEAVHVILGDSTSGSLRGCKAIVLHDNLAWGPADADPVRHRELRKEFWREQFSEGRASRSRRQEVDSLETALFSAHQLVERLAEHPPDMPVVLWTVALWKERLSFWWTLDAIVRTGLDRERFWMAEPALSDLGETSLGCFHESRMRAAFAQKAPLSAEVLRSGSALWRKYAAASPRAFEAARRKGVRAFPDLAAVGEIYGWLFPQADPLSRQLRLSRFDQTLFDRLQPDGWVRPIDHFQDRAFEYGFLFLVGDQYLASRLRAWAAHDPGNPALLSRREHRGVNSFTDTAYSLTPHGERIRQRGLERAEEAPRLFVGGCEVYRGPNPWVRRNGGQGWRIERLKARRG